MAQATSNGEWLEARNSPQAECVIVQNNLNIIAPTLTKEIKDSRHNQ
jgi:pyrimidine deaminase RibD-like protein